MYHHVDVGSDGSGGPVVLVVLLGRTTEGRADHRGRAADGVGRLPARLVRGAWPRLLARHGGVKGKDVRDFRLCPFPAIRTMIGVMQTSTATGPGGAPLPVFERDVVAGLVNDGMATLVAGAAVREAVKRGSRVRFVQVLPAGLNAEDRAEMDVAMFGVALRALHRQRRVPCTFEVVEGDAGRRLVERSRDAAVLVVGRDAPDAVDSVGRYCQEFACCDVLTVADPDSVAQPAGDMDVKTPERAVLRPTP